MSAAAARLRALVEALPDEVCWPWDAKTVELAATVADPTVVTALADHIDACNALEDFDGYEQEEPLLVWADLKATWRSTLRALEAAILRGRAT